MSATDRIREQFRLLDSVNDRGDVLVPRPDAEALCDLADAARQRLNTSICDWCYEDDCTGHSGADAAASFCPCSHACHDAEHEADEAVEAALARLDGEDGP